MKTGGDNLNLWVRCDQYYDFDKIDIGCDGGRVPSSVPSISSKPTSSSAPTTTPSTTASPTLSSQFPSLTPTNAVDCTCGVGAFKFQLQLKTDVVPDQTSWKIQDDNC